jgi:cation diffusion facilitator family transporter
VTVAPQRDLPPEKQPVLRRAVRLEWLTIAYLVSALTFLYLTLGNSQAMKAAWLEDMLSLLPPIAFLVATRARRGRPNDRFPWGYHRAVSIGYLTASLALLLMGAFIVVDSGMKLVTAEHPPIGVVEIFGQTPWLGFLMLPALAWSAIPAFFIGRAKLPLARDLHDKVLYADAAMNRADWMTASAAAVGVVGIGFGIWWADAVAAAVIGADITRDGVKNLRRAVTDLMDRRPTRYDGTDPHPVVGRAEEVLRGYEWVEDVELRMREEGHVMTGEALVVPASDEGLAARVEQAMAELRELDWRIQEIVVVPVTDLGSEHRGGG